MSLTKDHFIDYQEKVCEDFASGILSRDEAHKKLVGIGFDPHEAKDLLDNAI